MQICVARCRTCRTGRYSLHPVRAPTGQCVGCGLRTVARSATSHRTAPTLRHRNELARALRPRRDSGTTFANGNRVSTPPTPRTETERSGDVRTTPRAERHHRPGREPAAACRGAPFTTASATASCRRFAPSAGRSACWSRRSRRTGSRSWTGHQVRRALPTTTSAGIVDQHVSRRRRVMALLAKGRVGFLDCQHSLSLLYSFRTAVGAGAPLGQPAEACRLQIGADRRRHRPRIARRDTRDRGAPRAAHQEDAERRRRGAGRRRAASRRSPPMSIISRATST